VIRLHEIHAAVCSHYGVAGSLFGDRKRRQTLAEEKPKLAFYWAARNLTHHSSTEIGAYCGRHHSTVLTGAKRYQRGVRCSERTRVLLACAWWPEVYAPGVILGRASVERLAAE